MTDCPYFALMCDPTPDYEAGAKNALKHVQLPADVRRRLKESADYWQGFHDTRPEHPGDRIEDPTRPGGWQFSGETP